MSKVTAIIPACGFGTRVGMPPNKSKEMLEISNGSFSEFLIDRALAHCHEYGIEPLVLVRKEKTDLIEHCKKCEINYVIMEPGKEWAETVYNSKDHWSDLNVLILPDTRWQPTSILKDIKRSLEFGSEVVFAVHEVYDPENWGCVDINGYIEKPAKSTNNYAWGLIAFSRNAGEHLFDYMQIKDIWNYHYPGTNFLFLDEFKDLTRGNK